MLRSLLQTMGLLALGMIAGFLACLFSDSFVSLYSERCAESFDR